MSLRLDAAERLGALMQRVGFALWQLQELQYTAARYVVVRLRDARGVGAHRGAAISAEVEKLPLGKLLIELASAGVMTPDLASRLKATLGERNWLVHRSRREYRGVLSDPELYERLTLRLDRIADDALALHKELAEVTEEHVVSSG